MITAAFITIWNKRVGAIAWDTDSRVASFEYEPAFLRNNWNIAPVKMPIIGAERKIFRFGELKNTSTFKGLPGLLADVLPDKYGNQLIDAWLARNGRPSGSMNPVEMLCFIGKRGMGALEFEPVMPKSANKANKIEINNLVQMAQEILSGRRDFTANLSADEEKALIDVLKIGTSAGGARAKAVIAYNPATQEIRSGQAAAPKGFSHWLLKFDGVSDEQLGMSLGYGRVEMAYYLMATAAGITMTECKLLEENNRAHFMTRRFDREAHHEKIHVQSFCGLNHYDYNDIGIYSYEQLFETMRLLRLPHLDAEEMYRRMVFNVMARNCDDHTKNFSFLMKPDGQWKLAPAFDVCHSYRPGSMWVSQHSMSINGKRQRIERDDLLEVAKKVNIKKASAIIEGVRNSVSRWTDFARQTAVPDDLLEAIHKTLLLL